MMERRMGLGRCRAGTARLTRYGKVCGALAVAVAMACPGSPIARAQTTGADLPVHPAWPIDPSDAPPGLHEPIGVAVAPDGRLFVADAGNARLLAFDADGRLVNAWGRHGEGEGRFGHVRDVAWSTDGLWVVDDLLDKLERFDADGRFQVGVACADLGIDGPAGIGAGANGAVWVADSLGDRVVEVSRSGAVLASWGRSGDDVGTLSGPVDVALAADGSVVVLEAYRWQRFDTGGMWLQSRGVSGRLLGQFQHAWSVAAHPSGGWVIGDRTLHRLTRVDGRGVAEQIWGGPGGDLGRLLDPRGLAIDAAGAVVVADLGNGRVQRLTDGQPTQVIGATAVDAPHVAYPLAVAADGPALLVADTGRSRVVRLATDGRWLGVLAGGGLLPGLLTEPDGVARAEDGSVFVSDTVRRRVLHFAADGRYLSGIDVWGPSARPVRVGLLPTAEGLILADKKAHALVRYDAGGVAVGAWPTDNAPGLLGHPSGLARLTDGRLAVADWFQSAVHVLGADGSYAARWPAPGAPGGSDGSDAARLSAPTDVAAWRDGSIVVADAGRRRLAAFGADGTFLEAWGRGGAGPDGFGPSGPSALAVVGDTLVAVDRDSHRLLVFSSRPVTGWRVSDFRDPWLGGAPTAVRTLSPTLRITLPSPSLPRRGDDGSASTRAEGRIVLPPGPVRITVRAPVGVRLWHDGTLALDDWAGGAAERTAVVREMDGAAEIEWEVRWSLAVPGEADDAGHEAIIEMMPIELGSVAYLPAALQP